MSIQMRIDKARWWALTNEPFYGSLAMQMPDVMRPDIETAHTNGREIAWNPAYVEKLGDPQLRFVLLHETLHPGHLHLWRLPADERGNRAGDYEINLVLQEVCARHPGEIEMPEGGLLDYQYQGMACEEILALQPEPDEQDGEGGEGGGESDEGGGESQSGASDPCGTFGAPDEGDEGDGSDPAAKAQASQELRDQWEGAVIQANQAAQALGAGEIPGDMQRLLDKMRHQSVDWRREMADFVHDAMSARNDWTRSSRRHALAPVIYPRKRVDELGKVIFVRDTSGSVNDQQLAVYSALITDCITESGCSGLLIDADANIRAEYELNQWEPCPLTAKGGGGTDFRPVFNRAEELVAMGEHVAGIVYITDLCGSFPDTSEIPTLWLATTPLVAPFGRTVQIEN